MEDAVKKLTEDIKNDITKHLESPEVKEAIEATEKAGDAEAGTFEVVISTENLDRYDEVISLDGWELEHYRNNPVVLWGHDHSQLPVAIATNVEIRDGKLIAQGKFALHDFAQEVRQLYDSGVLRATSVGFIEKEREGDLITKSELIEFSFVTVPANPFALSTMVKSGISVNDMVTKGFLTVPQEKEVEPEEPAEEPETPEKEMYLVPKSAANSVKEIIEKEGYCVSEKDIGGGYIQLEISPSPEAGPEEEEPTEEEPTEPEADGEKEFDSKKLNDAIDAAKALTIALEALGTKSEEPEGNEPTDSEEDDETKGFNTFRKNRKEIQQAVTILDGVLAESRKEIEAQ